MFQLAVYFEYFDKGYVCFISSNFIYMFFIRSYIFFLSLVCSSIVKWGLQMQFTVHTLIVIDLFFFFLCAPYFDGMLNYNFVVAIAVEGQTLFGVTSQSRFINQISLSPSPSLSLIRFLCPTFKIFRFPR